VQVLFAYTKKAIITFLWQIQWVTIHYWLHYSYRYRCNRSLLPIRLEWWMLHLI